jgi:hypothetical protein
LVNTIIPGPACNTRVFAVALAAVMDVCLSQKAAAQDLKQNAFSLAVGIALRGAGEVNDCCGPFQASGERWRAIWIGGGISRRISSRIGLDGELTWAREPDYSAYFQGVLGDAPLRGYRAENRVQTVTAAGLVRLRSWHGSRSALDMVGGVGWAREDRRSEATSVVFRPGPFPAPTITAQTADARQLLPVIAGVDVTTNGKHFGLAAQLRFHWLNGAHDPVRTDLELGRQVVRFGVAFRRWF